MALHRTEIQPGMVAADRSMRMRGGIVHRRAGHSSPQPFREDLSWARGIRRTSDPWESKTRRPSGGGGSDGGGPVAL